ncbi:UDP-N-acetylmuramoylalanine--D-glutamate ligase [Candidatus Trichorickettsia mobilis]|uniref:UDP-N-acetylmuramoylalanine--D-glutamate ligase n=1 Tax=Candidatus Trichorickettsia mobilis TaxID=1346319 RepID=A0ABZ0UW67_9RICK|nr:UDP-N-acetylmuramoyl-L-alanine--D-glutamate ligase [Candidatus Trichorickettsia mobilis]WPY01238.1 UDP-N-acetylmuramoylalanine--D-glutamate ligase [Candidatus Trichorickettsia mobilis]
MIHLLSQAGKKIGIFGLNRTGIAAYSALTSFATQIICYDDNYNNCQKFQTIYPEAKIVDLTNPKWTQLDKILLSPGIPLSHPLIKIAEANKITITSDIDLLFEEYHKADFIAVTGTNGKSTTTALIAHILQFAGIDYPAGGNLGNAALSLPSNKTGYVLELSSFQLELINNFRAKIAILLNITPDHLDRHLTMDNYINAKQKILLPSATDSLCYRIIGVDNIITKNIYAQFKQRPQSLVKIIPVSAMEQLPDGITVLENTIYDNIGDESVVIELPYVKSLQGAHNRENIAASYAACCLVKVKPEQIVQALSSFSGLPHRMQYVGSISNIEVYNDSKATNAEAAIKSISTLDNIYWLAGGIAKSGGIEAIKPWFNRINKAYLFGQDKELFAQTLAGTAVNVHICKDLEEAVDSAFRDALEACSTLDNKKRMNILLAPAASSYDQFLNFEQRGEMFVKFCIQRPNFNAS